MLPVVHEAVGRACARGASLDSPGDRLRTYVELVRRWSERLDLTSPGDLERFEERHVADSLRLAPLVGDLPTGPAVDVGSGAGLPGIPLAIVGPERSWTLIERRARRAAFLETVVRDLELDCDVVAGSAEEFARLSPLRGRFVFGVARAVAPPQRAFALLAPLVGAIGVRAVFVGRLAPLPQEAEMWRRGVAIIRPGRESRGDARAQLD
jgi:16S rRNA (guanine(527)-N(7))-methyltransferase RsmG